MSIKYPGISKDLHNNTTKRVKNDPRQPKGLQHSKKTTKSSVITTSILTCNKCWGGAIIFSCSILLQFSYSTYTGDVFQIFFSVVAMTYTLNLISFFYYFLIFKRTIILKSLLLNSFKGFKYIHIF